MNSLAHNLLFISKQYLISKDTGHAYTPMEAVGWEKAFIDGNGNEAFDAVSDVPTGEYDVMCDGEWLASINI